MACCLLVSPTLEWAFSGHLRDHGIWSSAPLSYRKRSRIVVVMTLFVLEQLICIYYVYTYLSILDVCGQSAFKDCLWKKVQFLKQLDQFLGKGQLRLAREPRLPNAPITAWLGRNKIGIRVSSCSVVNEASVL